MKEPEMGLIAELIDRALARADNAENLAKIRSEVRELAKGFPLYPAQ
jgi:glycine/serine hydroxymethyltransferase